MAHTSSNATGFSDPHDLEYAQIRELYISEQYEACVAACKALVEQHNLSRSTRIRALAVWADATPDWYEAEDCRHEAERIFAQARMLYEGGTNEAKQEELRRLRSMLDDLLKTQQEYDPTVPPTDEDGNIIREASASQTEDLQMAMSSQTQEDLAWAIAMDSTQDPPFNAWTQLVSEHGEEGARRL